MKQQKTLAIDSFFFWLCIATVQRHVGLLVILIFVFRYV